MNSLYRIKSLTLKNFKCYSRECRIDFGSTATVIIGLNGSGKTTLLQALKKALSFILTKDSRQYNFVGDGKNIKNNTLKSTDATYPFEFSWEPKEPDYNIRLDCTGSIYGVEKGWAIIKEGKGRDSQMPYRDIFDVFLKYYNKDTTYTPLPLLAYFSDSFPHSRNDKSDYEKFCLNDNVENIERRAGYYRWDADNTDFYFWEGLFLKAYDKLNDFETGITAVTSRLSQPDLPSEVRRRLESRLETLRIYNTEIDYVTSFLRAFTRPLLTRDNESMEIESLSVGKYLIKESHKKLLRVNFTDGTFRFFHMLPEGYKRLFAMVFEIAYRYFILNRNIILREFMKPNPNTSLVSPDGIVIIDELELHLHPTLVEEVIARLHTAFPKVQFIISSHSPSVVANVHGGSDAAKVVNLNDDHSFTTLPDCYGVDYGETLVRRMHGYGRSHALQIYEELIREASAASDEETISLVRNSLEDFFSGHEDRDEYINSLITSWSEH